MTIFDRTDILPRQYSIEELIKKKILQQANEVSVDYFEIKFH